MKGGRPGVGWRTTVAVLVCSSAACSEQIAVESWAPLRFDVPPAPLGVLETRPDLKVAFIGDHGAGRGAEAVFRLVKAERADLVLSLGDLGYDGGPQKFDALISAILGPDFPFFAALGNHDADDWRDYHRRLSERARRSGRARCEGILGVKAACVFDGLLFITSAAEVLPGEYGEAHADYMAATLARSPSRWRICAWHFNQAAMQLGEKSDRVGWEIYEACRKGGAIIATAHEHSYARTHLITHFADPPQFAVAGRELSIGPGRTVAFVVGLGGRSVRPQMRGGDWWAARFTSDQGARPGALFCSFGAQGRAERSLCYFKTVDGQVADRFELVAEAPGEAARGRP